ncbi:MAG: MBL fold metallo-hydrolase, partial [bacterium]
VGAHLEALGIAPANITELDWGEGLRVGEVDLIATPAQHFSGRGVTDRNRTQWMGVAFVGPQHRQ